MFVVIYVAAMAAWSRVGRALIDRSQPAGIAARTMVGPVPVVPWRRTIVRDLGSAYETGTLEWGLPPRYSDSGQIRVGREEPGVAAAALSDDGAKFLSWSRYPRLRRRAPPERAHGRRRR